MRLTTVILIASLMQVSAATFGQRITLNKINVPLSSVLKDIRKQSGFDFFYDDKTIPQSQKINIMVTNATLDEALNTAFKGLKLKYDIEGTIVTISKDEPSFFDNIIARFQSIDVRGKVVDENGQPLVGATVKVKGLNKSTKTNAQGEFYLQGVDENATLQISFIGYKSKEMKATTQFEIKMELGSSELEEVAVSTGYFSTTKALSTMNITKVDGKDIENQPVTSLMNALVGRVAGLDITPGSGSPGINSKLQIRGTNSLNFSGGSNPLFVVDGVQIESRALAGPLGATTYGYDPLGGISPADIESIEVLKDAASTAIYGSKGSNGVIRITTKRARAKQDKTVFDFNVYQGMGHVANKIEMMNSEQYLQMRKEAFQNTGATPSASAANADLNGLWDTNRFTDWQEELLGGTSNITDIQGGFSGGNEFNSFRIGGSYHKETTVFRGDFSYQRATANFSFRHLSNNKKLEVTGGINFGYNENATAGSASFLNAALSLAPVAPSLYNADGSLNWEERVISGTMRHTWTNPLASLLNNSDNKTNSLISSATISYEMIPGLKARTLISVSDINNDDKRRQRIAAMAPNQRQFGMASMYFIDNQRKNFMVEPQLAFDKFWGNHNISTIAGLTFQQAKSIGKSVSASDYPSDALLGTVRGATYVNNIFDTNTEYKYASAYMRIGYDYSGKYILDMTVRRDGSSKFGPGKRFGDFGAIGIGWIFSKENFIKNSLPFLSFGKLRSSYGLTGNDQISDYKYLDSYEVMMFGYQDGISMSPVAPFNPDYGWESTKKFELALELGLFKDRVNIELAHYRNISSNQLIDYRLSSQTGFPSVLSNFDATIQNSGLEITASIRNIVKDNFQWTTSFNYTQPRTKLLKFDGIEGTPYETTYKVGEPLNLMLLYTYKGINPETGKYEVEDLNNDGSFDERDQTLMENQDRTSYFGLINSFSYKNVELSFLMQFSNSSKFGYMFSSQPGLASNQPISQLDRWQEPGSNAKYQKYIQGYDPAYSYAQSSNFNVTDAAFARLKTLSVAYNFSGKLLQRLKLTQTQLYMQGQNLFTITNFEGLDPESGNSMPPLRMITFGLRLKL